MLTENDLERLEFLFEAIYVVGWCFGLQLQLKFGENVLLVPTF